MMNCNGYRVTMTTVWSITTPHQSIHQWWVILRYILLSYPNLYHTIEVGRETWKKHSRLIEECTNWTSLLYRNFLNLWIIVFSLNLLLYCFLLDSKYSLLLKLTITPSFTLILFVWLITIFFFIIDTFLLFFIFFRSNSLINSL